MVVIFIFDFTKLFHRKKGFIMTASFVKLFGVDAAGSGTVAVHLLTSSAVFCMCQYHEQNSQMFEDCRTLAGVVLSKEFFKIWGKENQNNKKRKENMYIDLATLELRYWLEKSNNTCCPLLELLEAPLNH